MNLIVCGELAYDRILNFPGSFQEHILPDQIHKLSVSFFIERLEERFGGGAGNIVYNLFLLGEEKKSFIVSSAGKDFNPYERYLEKLGLATTYIARQDRVNTAGAYMITDQNNNQIAGFHLGAASFPSQFSFAQLPSFNPQDTIFLFAPRNSKEDLQRYQKECQQQGVRYLVDPGQTLPIFKKEELLAYLQGASMLIVNDYELQLVLDKTKLAEKELIAMTKILIITLGKKGSTIKTKDDIINIPACKACAVKDPTGAGDAYRAGLLKGLSQNLPLEHCGKIASLAATYAVEHYGTQEHNYTFAQFCERYQENFSEPCPLIQN
ncbi:MAG: hypothetical protein A2458_01360 [Candidatus Kerfeldbacteria bacterium RIFOXYC2_FULL_38_9]|nr:MAG: hypothetical protein A2458_01360 [Candidatus Kerfeldbacteria bacterium RIFOXYC2_FULL_38_9]